MKITRRSLAVAFTSAAASAQTQAGGQPANADEELLAAREQLRNSAEALARHKLDTSVEPAFQFKA